jgi:hypothetical protein
MRVWARAGFDPAAMWVLSPAQIVHALDARGAIPRRGGASDLLAAFRVKRPERHSPTPRR